ncbi:conotoxin Cl14.12-like [Babylonia areolata]|uniref:conotoxin Cl14.12-like n=1 Tax=Babylonia areolata TaxID=304850 RepID=UPI003FD571F6
MKVVAVLLMTLVVAHAAPQKRFLIKEIGDLFNNLGNQLTHVFNSAKNEFEKLTSGENINFDHVVDLLVNQIDSDATEGACQTACTAGATAILGPAAPLAGLVCGPACKAALAKIEEAAG